MRLVRLLLIVVVGVYLLAAILYAIPVASGALDDSMEVKFDRRRPVDSRGLPQRPVATAAGILLPPLTRLGDPALDPADRGRRRRSRLEQALRREPFALRPAAGPGRDDGLPVGLTVATNPFTFGMDFVGVNCAACHVGELRPNGKAVRVDGAPNMFNLQLFYSQSDRCAW